MTDNPGRATRAAMLRADAKAPVADRDDLTQPASAIDLEAIRIGLRLCDGLPEGHFCELWGCGAVRDLLAEVARLQADFERMRERAMTFDDAYIEATERTNTLQAQLAATGRENERLRSTHDIGRGLLAGERQRNDELKAENERLKAGLERAEFEQGFANVWLENERLRAALVKHHDLLSDEEGDLCDTCGGTWDAALDARRRPDQEQQQA